MSWLTSLFGFLKNLVKDLFNQAADSVAADAGPFLHLLLETAGNAVQAAQDNGGTGQEKWDAAVKVVTDTVRGAGSDMMLTTIETATQNAVQVLKTDIKAALNPPPTQTSE
jgi:hypothetical protein